MTDQLSLLVSFNTNALKGAARFDRDSKRAILEQGLARFRSHFPGVRTDKPNVSACAVTVTGAPELIEQVVCYLEEHKDFASYLVDGPMIRPATRG